MVVGNVNGEIKGLYSLIDKIQAKNGKFDLLLCVGKFFHNSEDVSCSLSESLKDLEQFYQMVIKGKEEAPIPIYFVDSTQVTAPFMHKGSGFKFNKRVNFLGKCGVQEISGLKIGFLSG